MPAGTTGSRARVVLDAASILLLSFVVSGNGNVLPQLFFQRHHPTGKVLLLAACLFVGTLASLAGVAVSQRARTRAWPVVGLLWLTVLAEGALFHVGGAGAYIALAATAQLGANLLLNQLDHAGAARAGAGHRRLHDAAGTTMRLVGMLAAPWFLARFADDRMAVHLVLGGLASLAFVSVASLLGRGGELAPASAVPAPTRALAPADRLFFGYALAVYVSLYLFAANLIYVLRDVAHLAEAEARGGMMMFLVYTGALVANGALLAVRRGPALRRAFLVAPALVLPAMAVGFASGIRVEPWMLPSGAFVAGASYGTFLAEVRDHASRRARLEGRPELLTTFNDLANRSALVAFAMLGGLAALHGGAAAGTLPWVLGAVTLLPLAGLPLLLAAERARVEVAPAPAA